MIEIVPLKEEHQSLLPAQLKDLSQEGTMLLLDRGEVLGYATSQSVDGLMTLDRYGLLIADPGHRLLDGLIKATLNRLDLAGHREVEVTVIPDYAEYFVDFRGEATATGYRVMLPDFFETACHAKKQV